MSVLSSPQGVPERVWSLVGGLLALGGSTDRESLDRLINPGFVKDGLSVRTDPKLAANALGAATSLGFIDAGREEARSLAPSDLASVSEFADAVHDRLIGLPDDDNDRVLLEAYAWVVAESDRQGDLAWFYEWSRDAFVDEANKWLVGEDEDGKPMNPTKLVAWRRWISFLGLGVPMPIGTLIDFPSPAGRIARELERVRLKDGEELTATKFLALLAERMPYLDGGRLFKQACERIAHQPKPRRLSPLLSAGLRDLHDEGRIRLRPRGDSTDAIQLADDPAHEIQTFNLVIIGLSAGAAA